MTSRTAVRLASVSLALAIGAGAGLGAFTFVYAKGYSYLSNDPAACVNCHVMRDQFDGWVRSSHRSVATCNDCHMPSALVPKLVTKAANGFLHSLAFTTGDFPEPIVIKAYNRDIAEEACRSCHAAIVHDMDVTHRPGDQLACIGCHGSVGHPLLAAPSMRPPRGNQ